MRNPLPYHPVLLAAYPILFLYFHNIQHLYFSPSELFLPLLLSCGFALIATFLLSLLLRHSGKAALIVSVFLALFYSYGHLHARLEGWTAAGFLLGRHLILLSWVGVVMLSLAFCCARARSFPQGITRLLNVFALLLVALRLATGFYGLWVTPTSSSAHDHETSESSAVFSRPHIFYIIADGYARQDVLKNRFGINNSWFIKKLVKSGFYVAARSNSNYNQTILSISSSLNFTYLDGIAAQMGERSPDKLPLAKMLRYNKAASFARDHGYKVVAFATGYSDTELRTADTYLQPPGFSLTEFQSVLLNTTPLPAILEVLAPVSGRLEYDQHRARVLFTLKTLGSLARSKTPLFVFAHILIPHQPYVFGPNGEPLNPSAPFSLAWRKRLMTKEQFIQGYHDQALFVTRQLQKTVDAILLNSPTPPIIIIQGDHGYEAKVDDSPYTNQDYRDRMAILNAYHLPADAAKKLYPSISPVNSFRLIFSHYFSANLPLLPDKSYFSSEARPYDFINLQEILATPAK